MANEFKITVVDRKATRAGFALGLSKERINQIGEITENAYDKTETITDAIEAASEFFETKEELVFGVFTLGYNHGHAAAKHGV